MPKYLPAASANGVTHKCPQYNTQTQYLNPIPQPNTSTQYFNLALPSPRVVTHITPHALHHRPIHHLVSAQPIRTSASMHLSWQPLNNVFVSVSISGVSPSRANWPVKSFT